MLFSANTAIPDPTAQADAKRQDVDLRPSPATEAGKIRLGGGFRPAAQTKDANKIRLGGGFRRSGEG